MIKIDQPIIAVSLGSQVTKTEDPEPRPEQLSGVTYKIKPGSINDAIYITINNLRDRVYELFIATKHPELNESLGIIARLISALWRREPNPAFIIEEMKAVKSLTSYYAQGKLHDSIVAHIADIIEAHMLTLGALKEPVIASEPEICIDCE